MTRSKDNAKKLNLREVFGAQEDFLRGLIQQVVQQVLEAEMDEALGAEKGQRTPNRLGYRSGYYSRTLTTRVGKLELRVPQDRQGRFRTEVFERYQRSEKALVAALAEMYVQGVSTRKVKAITEELCGHEFSASSISRINESLDEELAKFAGRQLVPYERGSVLISSNLPFSKWEAIFKDPMTTAAAIDRLVHHSVIFELNIASYRMEQAKKNQQLAHLPQ